MISILENFQYYLLALIILSTALLIYSPSVRILFLNDEIAFIQHNEVPSLLQLPSLFEKKDYDEFYYRPIPNIISGLMVFRFLQLAGLSEQKYDNYFILFNNDKNVKFDNNIYSKDNPGALTINYQEVRNKILYTFSSGAFYKLRGME